eukprot:2109254-Heterocapsa_arctica.AAC.1
MRPAILSGWTSRQPKDTHGSKAGMSSSPLGQVRGAAAATSPVHRPEWSKRAKVSALPGSSWIPLEKKLSQPDHGPSGWPCYPRSGATSMVARVPAPGYAMMTMMTRPSIGPRVPTSASCRALIYPGDQ